MGYTDGDKGVTGAAAGQQQPRLLDEVRRCLWLKHNSVRTEQAYVAWIRRFILASDKRHPREMGGPEVERFLTGLAIEGTAPMDSHPKDSKDSSGTGHPHFDSSTEQQHRTPTLQHTTGQHNRMPSFVNEIAIDVFAWPCSESAR